MKNLGFKYLLLLVAICLSLNTGIHAVTVDMYQNMESGSDGIMLTSTTMNASSYGGATWRFKAGNMMWVSNNNSRQLPGQVIVSGVNYNVPGTRSWMFCDKYELEYVVVEWDAPRPNSMTVACYFTPGQDYKFWNNHDNIELGGSKSFGVLQTIGSLDDPPHIRAHSCSEGWSTTHSPENIKVTPGKTYWVNLHLNGTEGKCKVAIFDPDNGWAQVGPTAVAQSVVGNIIKNLVHFGRCSSHGDNTSRDETFSYFDHVLVDYTNAVFPLLPDLSGIDTTPPSDISSVSDGTGSDINSTLSKTELSANWSASTDSESSIFNYKYAIGSSAGATDVVDWISNSDTDVTKSGLSLSVGTTYYFSVKAVNGMGLESTPANSDGQYVADSGSTPPPPPPTSPTPGRELNVKTYPNPLRISRSSQMQFSTNETNGGEIKIYTISGKLVSRIKINHGETQIGWNLDNTFGNTVKNGVYIYSVTDSEGKVKTGKIAITR